VPMMASDFLLDTVFPDAGAVGAHTALIASAESTAADNADCFCPLRFIRVSPSSSGLRIDGFVRDGISRSDEHVHCNAEFHF
jgi:hypothetical protein